MLEWEPCPSRGWAPRPRLSSPGEWERKAMISRRVGGSVCCSFSSVSNSLSNTTLSIKWEVYFSKGLCPLVFIASLCFCMHLHMSIQQDDYMAEDFFILWSAWPVWCCHTRYKECFYPNMVGDYCSFWQRKSNSYKHKSKCLKHFWIMPNRCGLVSLFNGISIFVGYLIPKLSL